MKVIHLHGQFTRMFTGWKDRMFCQEKNSKNPSMKWSTLAQENDSALIIKMMDELIPGSAVQISPSPDITAID